MSGYYEDDYRYSEEARDRDLRIVWECDKCSRRMEQPPGFNEGGDCHCGGTFVDVGETYSAN